MERWLVAGAVLTGLSGAFGYGMLAMVDMAEQPTLSVTALWMVLMGGVAACFLLWETIKLAIAKEPRPIAVFRSRFDWKRLGIVYLGCFLLGLNLAFFGIVKPMLGQVTPFTADKLLADIDHMIFGIDPWRLVSWLDHPGMSFMYHEMWFLWLAFVLMFVLLLRPSPEKDRALISYFLLWSIFGPVVHLIMPAAGPIFYDELGLGSRFMELQPPKEAQVTAYYLWHGFTDREFNAAGGISAMPSLHIATMFWSIFVLRRTKWFVFSIAYTAYIFLCSVALGWHYAVDGLAGAVGAALIYWAANPLPKLQTASPGRRSSTKA